METVKDCFIGDIKLWSWCAKTGKTPYEYFEAHKLDHPMYDSYICEYARAYHSDCSRCDMLFRWKNVDDKYSRRCTTVNYDDVRTYLDMYRSTGCLTNQKKYAGRIRDNLIEEFERIFKKKYEN